MAIMNEYKSISIKAKKLLNQQEGYDVDFKQNVTGLDAADLVAFANSDKGGSILVWIKEIQGTDGRQITEIVGCPVGDREKLTILNKAESCVPPVKVEIIVENLNHTPFFRVEIPSGKEKPYSTSGGTYKIRGDGRTKSLIPGQLLSMFLETESESFINRFRKATNELNSNLDDVKERVTTEMNSLLQKIRQMEFNIDRSLEGIFNSAENAESLSDEAMNYSDETLGAVHELDRKVDNLEGHAVLLGDRLKALLEKFEIEDPREQRFRIRVESIIKELYSSNPNIKKEEALSNLQEKLNIPSFLLEDRYEQTMIQMRERGDIV